MKKSNQKHFVPPLLPSNNSNVTISSTRKFNQNLGIINNNNNNNNDHLYNNKDTIKNSQTSNKSKNNDSNSLAMSKNRTKGNIQNIMKTKKNDESPLVGGRSIVEGESSTVLPRSNNGNHHQEQENVYTWPIPFDDQLAISKNNLPSLPQTNDLIKEQIHDTKNLLIRVITWNQQAKQLFKSSTTSSPATTLTTSSQSSCGNQIEPLDETLTKKLFSSNSMNSDEDDDKRYHIIAIGTQECENSISRSILNPLKEKWEKYCKESLGDDYTYVQGHALQASHLVIFVHKAIVHLISNVQSYAVPTGIYNTLGNKGGIGIRLSIGSSSFCFLTAHLAAHQDQIDRRTYEFAKISNEIANKLRRDISITDASGNPSIHSTNDDLNASSPTSLTETLSHTATSVTSTNSTNGEYQPLTKNDNTYGYSDETENGNTSCCSKTPCCASPCSLSSCCDNKEHVNRKNPLLREFDHVIWSGDLNYRINATRDVVDSLLEEDRHDVLISNDQLGLLLQFEKTFAGFKEGPITFRPTYKYDKGKDVYDTSSKKRIPAWTDRILYKSSSHLELLSYFCNQDIRDSDHRPVYASFKCQIEMDPMSPLSVETTLRSESKSEVCVIS